MMRPADGPLDVLVVDDEPLARRGIRDLLDRQGGLTVREASSGSEAVRMIAAERPDLVFLDVQMPRMDGFGVIEAIGIPAMPPVIFVTAYDEHALRAFEVHAVDYLLKPVDPERFRDAVDRARDLIAPADPTGLKATMAALLALVRTHRADPAGPDPGRRLAVRHQERIVFIRPEEVDWVEAQGNYVALHVGRDALRHRATMDEIAGLLGTGFVRVRRSALIRADAIRYCEPWGKGRFIFVLHDQTRITSSRYFRDRLRPLLGG